MNIPDELLAAYIDGELHGAERARIEQAVAHDARLAQRVAQYRSSRARLRGASDGALHEPMPQRLLQGARFAARPTGAQVIDLARVRAERKRRSERHRVLAPRRLIFGASMFGALLLGVVGDRLLDSGAPTRYHDGMLLASGRLAEALNDQFDRQAAPGNNVQVGITFRARGGNYCRTFSINDSQPLSGLACRDRSRWRVLTLLGSSAAAPSSQGSAPLLLAPLLQQTVREHISGAPLDASAEVRARSDNWSR